MKPIVPEQKKGGHSATAYAIKTRDIHTAHAMYLKARKNLLDVNQWHHIAGPSSAFFQVFTNEGAKTDGIAAEGNYLRINIPAIPGSAAGGGYDWVKVEKIEEQQTEDPEFIAMRVRPSVPPFYNKEEVAHFFTRDATSTFCVERKGRKVKAAVYGRNEKPNTKVHSFFNKLRNLFVAAGAIIGLNKPQWKSLVKGLLNRSQE